MSKTTYIVLLVLGVIGVFVAFFVFSSANANAAAMNGQDNDYASSPYTGSQNGTAPNGATGSGMPKAVKYGLYAVAPIAYITNASVVKKTWSAIKGIF